MREELNEANEELRRFGEGFTKELDEDAAKIESTAVKVCK
jgi:hypothetical protein